MNMEKFKRKEAPTIKTGKTFIRKETFTYKSLKINLYKYSYSQNWQATNSAMTQLDPYGHGATADEAVREMLCDIDKSIKNLNILRQDALEALGEECKNKQEVQNG